MCALAQRIDADLRLGRRGEALDVYRRLRTVLVAELGVEPSAPLGRLQRSILTARPDGAP